MALPLLPYVRGRAAPLTLALLIGVTLLPLMTAFNVSRDLWYGPVQGTHRGLHLKYTDRPLDG